MKRINTFIEALDYVNRLGFAGSGNIANRQHNLCDVTDSLHTAAGEYPYRVQFHRSPYAPKFPFLGTFTVIGACGRIEHVKSGK
jgi:hypothetical protein